MNATTNAATSASAPHPSVDRVGILKPSVDIGAWCLRTEKNRATPKIPANATPFAIQASTYSLRVGFSASPISSASGICGVMKTTKKPMMPNPTSLAFQGTLAGPTVDELGGNSAEYPIGCQCSGSFRHDQTKRGSPLA